MIYQETFWIFYCFHAQCRIFKIDEFVFLENFLC